MLKKREAELYAENLKPMSIDGLNTNIDQSLEDAANDNVISAKDLRAEIKKWNNPFDKFHFQIFGELLIESG